MNRIEEFDALRSQDWSSVYADVPDCINEGVQLAFARIRAHERRRKNVMRVLACAACLVLVAGVAGITLRREPESPDRVVAAQLQLRTLTMESVVYAAQADACFHVDSGCSAAMAEQVQLQLVTAMEFEKELCPVCGRNIQLP